MTRIFLLTLLLVNFVFAIFGSNQAQASQFPRYLGNEKKFRAYIYNPNDVYRYIGHYTYQGFIEFGGDEVISTISMGDTSLWLFEYLGNRLFLKPIAQNADTNMTVITNKKVYHFELTAKIADSIDDKDLIFVVKFIYPDEKDKNIIQFPKKALSDEPDLRDLSKYNFNYEYTGEAAIAPIKVFDDGKFTYMQFAAHAPEMPAAFSVDSAGFEELVNFRIAGDYMVIERVSAQFTLRNGADIVCIYNNNRLANGRIAPPKSALKTPISAPSFNSTVPENPIAPPAFVGRPFPAGTPLGMPAGFGAPSAGPSGFGRTPPPFPPQSGGSQRMPAIDMPINVGPPSMGF